jgi:hypothetical protein
MPVPTSNQGAESKRWLVPLLANLETRRVVGDPAAVADRLGVPLWHELGYGAGADGPFRRRLPIASLVPASKRPGAVARATEPAPAAPPTTLLRWTSCDGPPVTSTDCSIRNGAVTWPLPVGLLTEASSGSARSIALEASDRL